MTWLKRQRLLATNLRVELATGLQKAVTSLINGCDAGSAGTAGRDVSAAWPLRWFICAFRGGLRISFHAIWADDSEDCPNAERDDATAPMPQTPPPATVSRVRVTSGQSRLIILPGRAFLSKK